MFGDDGRFRSARAIHTSKTRSRCSPRRWFCLTESRHHIYIRAVIHITLFVYCFVKANLIASAESHRSETVRNSRHRNSTSQAITPLHDRLPKLYHSNNCRASVRLGSNPPFPSSPLDYLLTKATVLKRHRRAVCGLCACLQPRPVAWNNCEFLSSKQTHGKLFSPTTPLLILRTNQPTKPRLTSHFIS